MLLWIFRTGCNNMSGDPKRKCRIWMKSEYLDPRLCDLSRCGSGFDYCEVVVWTEAGCNTKDSLDHTLEDASFFHNRRVDSDVPNVFFKFLRDCTVCTRCWNDSAGEEVPVRSLEAFVTG